MITKSPEEGYQLLQDTKEDMGMKMEPSQKAEGPGDSSDPGANGSGVRDPYDRAIEYVSSDGQTVSAFDVYRRVKSGLWSVLPADEEGADILVRTQDGEEFTLTKRSGESEA